MSNFEYYFSICTALKFLANRARKRLIMNEFPNNFSGTYLKADILPDKTSKFSENFPNF